MSYSSALKHIDAAARDVIKSRSPSDWQEVVPLDESAGRTAALDVYSPESTPPFDTSAMDGYAVPSEATRTASPDRPILFRVQGIIAAGDDPDLVVDACLSVTTVLEDEWQRALLPCLEIMTGARFPSTSSTGIHLDACVRIEDVTMLAADGGGGDKTPIIAVTRPVAANAHRRFAGEDIQRGQAVLRAGQVLRPSHVMPLAAVGARAVVVAARPSVGVWSTGKELLKHGSGDRSAAAATIRDINGPFLVAACREQGALPTFLGFLDDNGDAMARALREECDVGEFDVLITSGGVSVGKFDFVRAAVEQVGGKVIFHPLAIRPGHPVLFALIPSGGNRQTAFIGLPGNPGAAAACFRFLIVPYLRGLLGQGAETPVLAKLATSARGKTENVSRPQDRDYYKPGVLQVCAGGNVIVDVSKHTGPAKLSPFISADCWIHYRPGQQANVDECVDCYPLRSGR